MMQAARQQRDRRQASALISQPHNRRHRLPLSLIQVLLVLALVIGRAHATKGSDERIRIKQTHFAAERYDHFYLKSDQVSAGDGETFVMRDQNMKVWISHDHGKTWKVPPELDDEQVSAVFPNKYFNDMIFFQTASGQAYYSPDRGKSIQRFNTPGPSHGIARSRVHLNQNDWIFHSSQKDWLIWFTTRDCQDFYSPCHVDAYLTQDRGSSWKLLRRNVQGCQFVAEQARGHREKLIYCEEYTHEAMERNNPIRLVTSDDFFEENISTPFDDIISVAVMSEFTIVAVRDEEQKSFKIETSTDGKTFEEARFPANSREHYLLFTLLDSSTHSVFASATTDPRDLERGSIFKSNSNGTSFVQSISGVNVNSVGFVDFQRMQGLNGVALSNIIANAEETASGWPKKLRTAITYDDGATWGYIPPPSRDVHGMPVKCDFGNREWCSLHLHGPSDRRDPASSPSAVGLMLAVGNFGEYLGDLKDSDTYITRDGGLSWNAFLNGPHIWEYGDQGSVILLVKENTPTNTFHYTLDEGRTWKQYQFTDSAVQVVDISSVLNSQTLEFLLWAKEVGRDETDGRTVTFNVDFTELRGERKCVFAETENDGDFFLWEPRHPARRDSCSFGHIAQYPRKKPAADCYVGADTHSLQHTIKRNCTCTRVDYECAFNSEPQPDGSCAPVPGLHPTDHCRDPNVIEWYAPASYRRTTLTTCDGGLQFDTPTVHPCPAPEKEEEKPYMGLWAWLWALVRANFLFVTPLAAAAVAGVGWWIYSRSTGRYGRIRLEDSTKESLRWRKEEGYADAVERGDDSGDDE
ncbi:hypothetical protein GP486_004018 [Trichoglossum hirsutum]|uniref:Vacuolar protein sorting/targeting protein 10 n=1 Tax=Trichoglossum hirsutum TaxID=265104 RepID=A0A9P8LBW7_9PEZI|nr:hypothetical protein GP486_004018 [Trichoglossum hirsutum]